MNMKTLVTAIALLASAGAVSAHSAALQDSRVILAQAGNTRNLEQGLQTEVTMEDRKNFDAERAAKKQASANQTHATFKEREKQAAEDFKRTPATNLEQGTQTQVSAEQRKQFQIDRVLKNEAAAQLTFEERKSAAKEKGRASLDIAKGATGD